MSDKVLVNIAQRYEHVREGVKSVMGGKVLKYEAKPQGELDWKRARKKSEEMFLKTMQNFRKT